MPTIIPIKDANGNTVNMVVNPAYDAAEDMIKMKSVQKKWRDSFTQSPTVLWDVTSVNGSTATASAGVLTINSGSNAGGYVEMLSKEAFTIPLRVMFAMQVPTRRANTMHMVELVSVNATTGLPDERNRITWSIGGSVSTTATVTRYEVQNGGIRPLVSGNETITTTASYTVFEIEPFADEAWIHQRTMDAHATGRAFSRVRHQQIPDPNALYKIRIRSMNVGDWAATTVSNATDSGGLIQITTSAAHGLSNGAVVWIDSLVGVTDANNTATGGVVRGLYTIGNASGSTFTLNGSAFGGTYLAGSGRYAVATAPTGGTADLQFQFIHCQDYAELTAEVTASRGSNVAGQALPVAVTSMPTTTVSGSVNATLVAANVRAGYFASAGIWYDESSSALLASVQVTGGNRDLLGVASATAFNTATAYPHEIVVSAESDVTGTLWIEVSRDNTNWRRVKSVDTTAVAGGGFYAEIVHKPSWRYFRCGYLNGLSNQTRFALQQIQKAT